MNPTLEQLHTLHQVHRRYHKEISHTAYAIAAGAMLAGEIITARAWVQDMRWSLSEDRLYNRP